MKSFERMLVSSADPSSSGSKAKFTESKYESELGEAGPLHAGQQPLLPRPLEKIVLGYLASDVDVNPKRYSEKHLAEFKLFGMPVAMANQIARHYETGARTKALDLIRKNPSSLQCVALARDGFGIGRQAAGTPLGLAVIMGDFILAGQIKEMLSKAEANAQLHELFSPGWEEEQKERDARYLNAAIQFRDRLLENRLPNGMPYTQAVAERKESILEYREALRPKPNDRIITRAYMVNPQIYRTIRELYLKSEADLGDIGSLDVSFLWGIGFQSLLGAGPPTLGQILIGGANNLGDPSYMPPEVLAFKDGTSFYDPNPLSGVGATLIVSLWGDKYALGAVKESGRMWAAWRFWKTYVEQQHQYCRAYAASSQTDDNDVGTSVELRFKS